MATKKNVLSSFDLEAYRKQKAEIERAANEAVANSIDQIKELLNEIERISRETGLEFNLGEINYAVRDIEDGWKSSNCY